MKNTGALLKTKRESSNFSLSEVALATKINPKILAAIENGDEKNLPAKTILKGFVRSYALFLKMDVDSVMRSFQDEMGGPPPTTPVLTNEPVKPSKNESSPKSRRVDEESSNGLRTVAVVVIVLLIGLIIGVRELIEKYQRERVVEASTDLNKATPVVAPPTEAVKTEETVVATPDVVPDNGDTVDTSNSEVVKAEAKPVEVKTSEEKPRMSSAPVISPRNLVQMPINNLVELRPTELSPRGRLKCQRRQNPLKLNLSQRKLLHLQSHPPRLKPISKHRSIRQSGQERNHSRSARQG